MSLAGRRVIVSRPDGSERGRLGVDIAAALGQARAERAAACLLPPRTMANEWLFALTTDEVPLLQPQGATGAWLGSRWEMRRLAERGRARAADTASAFWLEWYRELRRHVADERLPLDFRGRLRGAAQRSFARSAAAGERRTGPRFPRAQLRHAIRMRLPEEIAERARAEAERLGIPVGPQPFADGPRPTAHGRRPTADGRLVANGRLPTADRASTADRIPPTAYGPRPTADGPLPTAHGLRPMADGRPPIVAVDVHEHVDGFDSALDRLRASGYTPVRLGLVPLVDVYLLLTSAFLVCDNADAQRTAYLTATPTLTINATDAFAFYPVRADGVFLLKTAIDLDTGRTLAPSEMLSDAYYRNARNLGHLEHTAAEVHAAVDEMIDGVRNGWRDTAGQAEYRARVTAAGEALAGRIRHVAKWGPVDGFIGDGRLARVQAERIGLEP